MTSFPTAPTQVQTNSTRLPAGVKYERRLAFLSIFSGFSTLPSKNGGRGGGGRKFIWKSSAHQLMAEVAASDFTSTSAVFSASGCLFTAVSRENIP